MNTETIGTWAGLVWNALNEADVLGSKQIKKITKLKATRLTFSINFTSKS